MKLTSTLPAFFLLMSFAATAQHLALPMASAENGVRAQFEVTEAEAPFYTLALRWNSDGYTMEQGALFEMRLSSDGLQWDSWQVLQPEPHSTPRLGEGISELQFVATNHKHFEVRTRQGLQLPEGSTLEVHLFNPGHTEASVTTTDAGLELRGSCPCPEPQFQGRNDWCPSGNCQPVGAPTFIDVTHLIIHHSAGVTVSSDWPAVVRAIWSFHVNTNGWDDIGYNWLVDANGVLYEGRGDGVRGAHFCAQNGGTMGVCVLGNFTSTTPTEEAVNTLVPLLAWKSCDLDLDPQDFAFHVASGLNLFHISGHRDGCNTACPGDAFYPSLPIIRDAVESFIATSCAPLAAPTNLVAPSITAEVVNLQWHDNSDNETKFLLERTSLQSGDFEQIAELSENTSNYEDDNLETDITSFVYRVRAVNDQDTSAYSNELSVSLVTIGTHSLELEMLQARLFPNPANESIQLSMLLPEAGQLRLQIIALDGTKLGAPIEWQAVGGRIARTFPVGHLPAGNYWLQVQFGDRRGSIPFQKY